MELINFKLRITMPKKTSSAAASKPKSKPRKPPRVHMTKPPHYEIKFFKGEGGVPMLPVVHDHRIRKTDLSEARF
jgi:hypothetical protein